MQSFYKSHQTATYIAIFLLCLVVRIAFTLYMGSYNNYALEADSKQLIEFADQALQFNFNFDYGRFITSPLFSIFAAVHKILFGVYWGTGLLIILILISSLSGVYIFKITQLLFNKINVSLCSALIYAFFPLTIWFVQSFSQEMLFQTLYIFTTYHLIKYTKTKTNRSLYYSAILYSLSFLTKSHILLFSPFIIIIFYYTHSKNIKQWLKSSIQYASICLLFALPYFAYHLIKNDLIVISSNGAAYQFYLGNTNVSYHNLVEVENTSSIVNPSTEYYYGEKNRHDSIITLPINKRQKIFFQDALHWMKNNPSKWFITKLWDIYFFLIPGVSYKHYPFTEWLITFAISLPLYLFAYTAIVLLLKQDPKNHLIIAFNFITMLLFSTIFYVQNRFRSITIEPLYICYASYMLIVIYEKYMKNKHASQFNKLKTIK